jgi:hypothetical protein|tara:strand:- start:710 stop:913 length:204 start_codon:yes stop_codon:yes gene_type:complete
MANKHQSSTYKKIERKALKLGFRLEPTRKGTFYFSPNPEVTPYLAHPSEKAIHELRRWFKRQGINIM